MDDYSGPGTGRFFLPRNLEKNLRFYLFIIVRFSNYQLYFTLHSAFLM